MSSLFVAFCFTKNVNRNDKCISRTALYRINHNVDKFREDTFKGGDYVLTPEDLPSSSPLLIYSATVVVDSYIPDNQDGQESFMIARQLYNGVTNNRNMESRVIVFYKNENNRYNAMKNNLKKTVLSVIGCLKIGSKKFSHVLASDIEWTYVSNDPLPSSTTTNAKGISEVEFDKHLDGTSSVKMADTEQSSSTTNFASISQNTSQHISSRATCVEDEEDAALISDNEPTELVQVQIQDAMLVIKEKHGKNLRSAKK
ncbi:hypothetical protein F8M41_005406 [Gigaspora margarita]|uniref:Uncharacterized protein n=1 Tax=Gigaspora margarita TaxID=4874 RepID=A0A8H3XAR0_GIGMA|nr:hypothetical protein F8M41_005406 [Gigaspora margarita]